MSDLAYVLIWWFTIFVIGTIFLPITNRIFKGFIDRGYIFTKIIGVLFASYLVWLLGSLHLLPFSKFALVVVLIGFSSLSIYILNTSKTGKDHSIPWKWFIFEEILFFAALSFWSYVRATEPSIRSLEKFMDFGFVNSILRATFFPPLDMWLAKSPQYLDGNGGFINYYYFGHYITAFLTKLSGLDSAVTYNLMIATLFAFTFTLPFSLGANLYYLYVILSKAKDPRHGSGDGWDSSATPQNDKGQNNDPGSNSRRNDPGSSRLQDPRTIIKIVIVGLLAGFLVALAGNLHTLYVFTSGYPNENPMPPWQLTPGVYPERYWYPNATRFIPFTIHEFPIYSFVVADLHGHVSDIPLVMLVLALLLVLISSRRHLSDLSHLGHLRKILAEFQNHTSVPLPTIIFLGILLAVMYMTNAWDGLIYMILTGLVFLYLNLSKVILSEAKDPVRDSSALGFRMTLLTALYKTFSASLFLLFFFLLASLPFSLNFKPFVSGIGVLCAPGFLLGKKLGPFLFEADKCQKSPIYQLAILWGFFYFNVIGYLLFVIIPSLRKKWEVGSGKLDLEVRSGKNMKSKISHFPFQYLTSYFSRLTSNLAKLSPIDIFVLLLILVSTLLLIFPEYFYIKDIYPAHYRANTMFKLGYQAFMMLGIASAYIFIRIKQKTSVILSEGEYRTVSSEAKNPHRFQYAKFIFNVFFFILFFLVAIYPYFAVNSYYGNLKVYRGLYGLSWMSDQYPDDYKAVEWMRGNISGQPVIVEANGDSYTDYLRVSANTGLPTIIGWPVHEWLWRGSYDEAGRRIPEVAAIYESDDLLKTKTILDKYKAEYIFVGTLEREKYKDINETKLDSLGEVVFQSGETKIIRIKT